MAARSSRSGPRLIEDAAASLARGGMRRLRAIVRAKRPFSGRFTKLSTLRPARPESLPSPRRFPYDRGEPDTANE